MKIIYRGGTVNITPKCPVPLMKNNSQYCGCNEHVFGDLEVNILILENSGVRIALIAFDLLYVGRVLEKAICEYLCNTQQFRLENILLAASHTHFAPSTDPTKPALGIVDDDYLQEVLKLTLETISSVLDQSGERADMEWGQAQTHVGIYRRLRWPWRVLRERKFGWTVLKAPNPFGPTDPTVRTLTIRSSGGQPLAILWNYACHPVGFPDYACVTPEYPGVVRIHLRQRFNTSIPIIFLQGFCGDIRPRIFQRINWRSLLTILNRGPRWGVFNSVSKWTEWCSSITSAADSALCNSKTVVADIDFTCILRTISPDRFLENCDDAPPLTIQAIRLTSNCVLVGVSAEPSVRYALELAKKNSSINWLLAGYCGDVFGYLPTEIQRKEGGYEGNEYLSRICSYGPLRPGLDTLWKSELNEIIRLLEL